MALDAYARNPHKRKDKGRERDFQENRLQAPVRGQAATSDAEKSYEAAGSQTNNLEELRARAVPDIHGVPWPLF